MKNTKKDKSSIFWKPTTTGESIEGIFGGFESRKDLNGDDAMIACVGERKINVSASLKSLFAGVYTKLSSGKSKVKLVYLGTDKVKSHKGWTVKLFNLYVDGKQVLNANAGTPATTDYVKNFFGGK